MFASRHITISLLASLALAASLAACGGAGLAPVRSHAASVASVGASVGQASGAPRWDAPAVALTPVGTLGSGATPAPLPASSVASRPAAGLASSVAAALVAGPLPASLMTPGAVSASRPWSSSRPTGHGRRMTVFLPAPWTGGSRSAIAIDVYLPPGYDAGAGRYPVVYEVPYGAGTWNQGMQLTSVLDGLIRSGAIPPAIVVFADQFGGPYPDSECANSIDGREWFDRFVATDLVHWVDTHLLTIATPASRATFGFSAGGYCSAALLAHHPDLFGSAIVLSGYFVAGIRSGTTPTAGRPFNNDPAVMKAVSPMTVVPLIPTSLTARLFYVIEADPTQGFYGPQMARFAAVLHAAGVPMAIIPTPLGHSWAGARRFVPTMLELVFGRMVSLGVFGPVQ